MKVISDALLKELGCSVRSYRTGKVVELDDRAAQSASNRYLRFGYWSRVDLDGLNKILNKEGFYAEEWDDYDDDCGYLFSYHIKNLK